jgi:hypothetical protein
VGKVTAAGAKVTDVAPGELATVSVTAALWVTEEALPDTTTGYVPNERVFVLMESVALPAPIIGDGATLQLPPLGSPLQDKATDEVNPPIAFNVTVDVAGLPGATMAGSGCAAIRKSGVGD